MTGLRRRCTCGAFLLGLALTAAIAAADNARYVGRPVVEVLLELRDARLDFIYSSELVPATLRVLEEPRSSNRLLIAREILQAHGLGLSVVRIHAVPADGRIIVGSDRPAPRPMDMTP